MKVYKYNPDTGDIEVEDSKGNATLHIPIAGSYEYEHGKKEVARVPSSGQTPTWNFNNPLQNWNFPVLNKLKDLISSGVTKLSAGSETDTSTLAPQFPAGTTDVNNDGEVNVIDILASQQLASQQASIPPALAGATDVNNDGAINVLDIMKGMQPGNQWDTSPDFPPINEPTYNKEPFDMSQGLNQILEAIQGVPDLEVDSDTEETAFPWSDYESKETFKPVFGTVVPGEYYEVDEGQGMTKYEWGTGPYNEEFEKSSKEGTVAGAPDRDVASTDYGLFQINDYWHDENAQDTIWNQYIHPKDMSPIEQVHYAKSLYDKEGWDVWAAYNNGSYKKFLDWTDDDYKDKGVSMHDLRRINLFFNNPDGSGSAEEARIAKAIMYAESAGKRDAINRNKKKANS